MPVGNKQFAGEFTDEQTMTNQEIINNRQGY